MPTIIAGAQASDVVLDTNQMPDNDAVLYTIKPSRSKFFQKFYFSQRKAKEVTDATGAFSYFTDELYPWRDSLTGAGIAGGGTSEDAIGLSNPSYFQANDILLVEATDELVYVDSIAGGDVDITSMDGGNITAATTGDVQKLGSRNAEDNSPKSAVATQEVKNTNYLTIFNESVEMTSREQAAKHFTNGKTMEEQVQKRIEEMKDMFERYLLYSTESGRNTSGSSPVTWGKGFNGLVTTNRVSYVTATEDALDAFFQTCFDNGGSDVRDFHLGSNLTTAVNKILKDRYQATVIPGHEYGVDLSRYLTPFGMINIMWNPRMDGKFTNFGFLMDWEDIYCRYMANDDKGSQKFRVEEHVEANGQSTSKVKLYADLGVQISIEKYQGVFYK